MLEVPPSDQMRGRKSGPESRNRGGERARYVYYDMRNLRDLLLVIASAAACSARARGDGGVDASSIATLKLASITLRLHGPST